MNVSNRKCIRNISFKSMKSSRTRNIIAIIAIALTAVLFTALFTIAMSILYGIEQSNFRMVGGYSHGCFKYLSKEQVEELCDDPLIQEYGVRCVIGMPEKEPFNKAHVEVSWASENDNKYMFLNPKEGRFPHEGSNEAATDTRVLSLLGVEPEIGTEFTMTINADRSETTETFTLCGWWEYDSAIVASHVIIPESRMEEILAKPDVQLDEGSILGTYTLDVMFKNDSHIEQDLLTILERHGYQSEDPVEDNYIAIGVNWGYMGAQLSDSLDPATALSMAAMLLLILFTGYLIIYNVFQISVSNDIRFYGLLKTIGCTGRQLRRMVFLQALFLSAIGIPIGLLIGWGTGAVLTPVVISNLNGVVKGSLSVSPWIFIASALFSLETVIISCRKPGKMAAKVSPIEALRYSDGVSNKKSTRKAKNGASIYKMALANMGRNRKKTAVTTISLSLAVVILTTTVTFVKGFDIDKYIGTRMNVDYMIADAGYFQVAGPPWNISKKLDENVISTINEQEGIAEGGRTYGQTSDAVNFITEEHLRSLYGKFGLSPYVDDEVNRLEKIDDLLLNDVELYGMEPFCLDRLNLIDGDITKLYGDGNYIAAVYLADDYNNVIKDTNWANLGDTVSIRYIDEYEFYNTETGEVYANIEDISATDPFRRRGKTFRDIEYEVAAVVTIPHSLSSRRYGVNDVFVLGAETFIRDTGSYAVMYYAFNMEDSDVNGSVIDKTDMSKDGADGTTMAQSSVGDMESYMADLTGNIMTQYDYESRQTYIEDFSSFMNMFMILGSVLSFIVGFIGILNFLNAFLTSIVTRHREFAVLQAVGMTGSQLKKMLITEGEILTLGSVLFSFVLIVVTRPLFSKVMESVFWFFSYNFTAIPFAVVTPIFAILGFVLPLITYRYTSGKSIVERLREAE
ncbi:MAG: ABC transporter permease [Lachnospiraceae bacterium]|nr:ABC transporter permease [Lachnospiraceae bacterium]